MDTLKANEPTQLALMTVADRAKAQLVRNMGPLLLDALNDPSTVEVMLNPDGALWHERLGQPMQRIGTLRPAQAQAIIETVAGFHGKEATRLKPLLEGELPLDGSRFAGQLPPVVPQPCFSIRKKAVAVFSLDDYVRADIMTEHQCGVIKSAVRDHLNILVVGGTGSGKTTLVNAVISEMVDQSPNERVVLIEDTGEIQCRAVNHVQYRTSAEVSMQDLVKATLRMRPDRILVGEVRGPEALTVCIAWNSGHGGGVATLHANDSRSGLNKLVMLVSMHPDAPRPIEPLVGEAVQLVITIARHNGSRKITQLLRVRGYEQGRYITEEC